MPARRPDLAARAATTIRPQGAAAFAPVAGPPADQASSAPAPEPRRRVRFEDSHRRMTTYVATDVLAALDERLARTAERRSQVVSDAIAAYLASTSEPEA